MNSKTTILLLLLLIGSTIYGNSKTINSKNFQLVTNATKSTTPQRLDSIIVKYSGIDFKKYIYHYDENNQNNKIECFGREEKEANNYIYEPFYNVLGVYNEKGKVNEITVEGFDNRTPFTEVSTYYSLTYGVNGKIDQISGYSFNNFNSERDDTTYFGDIKYTYDSKGNNISILIPIGVICEKAYNGLNYKKQEVYYTGCDDCDKTFPYQKIEYVYDQEGKILKYDLYSKYTTEENEEWKLDKSETNEYLFDNYGNILQDQNYFHNIDEQSWIKSVRYFKTNSGKSYPVLPNFIFQNHIIEEYFSFENGLINLADNCLLSEEEISIWNNNKKEWEEPFTIYYYYSDLKTFDDSTCNLGGSLEDGLVAYYPFCGDANDESGNGNDGTVSGATLTTDRFGNQNSAFQFSGSDNSYIRVPNSSSLDITNNQITISMWVLQENTDSDLNWKGITKGGWNFGSGYELLYRNSYKGDRGGIQLSGNNGGIQADDVDINGNHSKWIHVVGLYDNDKGRVYINGKLISSGFRGKTFSNFISTDSPLLIGIRDSRNQYVGYVDGRMDDIGIWNRILSEQEIQELYHENGYDENCVSLNGSIKNGLVAYYPFCGNANDESGNGLNGTVNGATLASDRFGDQNSAYSFTTNQDIVIPKTETQNIFPLTLSLWYSIDSIKSGENGNLFSKYYPAQWNGYLIHVANNVIGGDSGIVTYPWYIRDKSNKVLGLYGEKPFYQSNVEVNKWYNYVYTVDETGGKIYVNGELVDTHEWTGESGKCSNVDLWKIGGKYDHWFHGKIDDIGIWNRVLTEDEIQQLYSTCKFNTAISPVANSIDKGANAVFEVSSNEPNLTYQWQTNPSNVGWLNVPSNTRYSGTSSNKLTVNDVQLSNHLQSFRVVASSETCTEISNTAYISLNDTCVNVMDEMNFISVTDTLIITVNLTGITSPTTNTIKVYPNPTKDYITINYGNLGSMNGCKFNISNSIGQVVYTSSIIEQIATIKLSSLGKTGLYFVNILDKNNNVIESKKLILKE